MNNLNLLFDAKQFAVAFGAATGDSSSMGKDSQPDASVRLEAGPASVGAGLSRDGGQKAVNDARLRSKHK